MASNGRSEGNERLLRSTPSVTPEESQAHMSESAARGPSPAVATQAPPAPPPPSAPLAAGHEPAQRAPASVLTPPATGSRRSARRIVVPILVVALIAAVIFGYRYWRDQSLYVSTDNAQIAGSLIQLGSVNAGQIQSVAVDIGNRVHQGEELATVTLPTTLTVTNAGTPRLGYRSTQDQQVSVQSPINGVVVQRLGNPGDTVGAGQAILTVVDPAHLWVQAMISETEIDRVKVGQRVDVHVDSLNQTLPGRVLAVDRASAASFSLLPQNNTSGNFTKVTQLVPVKIAVDYGQDQLVLGSSVEVKIHTAGQ